MHFRLESITTRAFEFQLRIEGFGPFFLSPLSPATSTLLVLLSYMLPESTLRKHTPTKFTFLPNRNGTLHPHSFFNPERETPFQRKTKKTVFPKRTRDPQIFHSCRQIQEAELDLHRHRDH